MKTVLNRRYICLNMLIITVYVLSRGQSFRRVCSGITILCETDYGLARRLSLNIFRSILKYESTAFYSSTEIVRQFCSQLFHLFVQTELPVLRAIYLLFKAQFTERIWVAYDNSYVPFNSSRTIFQHIT